MAGLPLDFSKELRHKLGLNTSGSSYEPLAAFHRALARCSNPAFLKLWRHTAMLHLMLDLFGEREGYVEDEKRGVIWSLYGYSPRKEFSDRIIRVVTAEEWDMTIYEIHGQISKHLITADVREPTQRQLIFDISTQNPQSNITADIQESTRRQPIFDLNVRNPRSKAHRQSLGQPYTGKTVGGRIKKYTRPRQELSLQTLATQFSLKMNLGSLTAATTAGENGRSEEERQELEHNKMESAMHDLSMS